jgi:hypothetical protein
VPRLRRDHERGPPMSGTQLPPAGERAGAEAYQGSQRQPRREMPAAMDRPGPLEFDGNGFPVAQGSPQRSRDFVTRVARLLDS